MRLILTRDLFGDAATLGRLDILYPREVEVRPFGFACEDRDRGLDHTMPLDAILAAKVAGATAIPTGVYGVKRLLSPKRGRILPWLIGVTGFRAVQIHAGNTDADTRGCVLPGLDRDPAGWRVMRSARAAAWLDTEIAGCESRGEPVFIEIRRDPAAWAARQQEV